jgi:hypothetical protein
MSLLVQRFNGLVANPTVLHCMHCGLANPEFCPFLAPRGAGPHEHC